LLLNNCDGYDAKHNNVFLGRVFVPLKRDGFILAAVQNDVFSSAHMHKTAFSSRFVEDIL